MEEELNNLAKELQEENRKTIDPLLDVLEAESIEESNQALWNVLSKGSVLVLFVLMIALNGILGLVLLVKLLFSGMLFTSTALGVIVIVLILIPVAYLFIGYRYSVRKVTWEVYDNILRTLLQKLVSTLVAKLAQNIGSDVNKKSQVVETIKSYVESIMNRIPELFHKYLTLATFVTETVDGVYKMRTSEGEINSSFVDRCADMLFNKFDKQLEDQLKPSLTPFYILLGINLVVAVVIWFMI